MRQAREEGPQRVTVYGEDVVMVVSAATFARMIQPADRPSLYALLSQSPLRHVDFDFEGERSPVRHVTATYAIPPGRLRRLADAGAAPIRLPTRTGRRSRAHPAAADKA